jgi:hypothetical protein
MKHRHCCCCCRQLRDVTPIGMRRGEKTKKALFLLFGRGNSHGLHQKTVKKSFFFFFRFEFRAPTFL